MADMRMEIDGSHSKEGDGPPNAIGNPLNVRETRQYSNRVIRAAFEEEENADQ